ncbi:MAG: FAD-dependent oxidoreductase, partial [SAR202 cluster bacterium]|nr:FAD-dependent oxidoreductase [SAR202 cluster bacterium]
MEPIEGLRLPARPGQVVDRTRKVTFTYNGKSVTAFNGDTIASALYASGITIFSRSFKYHRPRGLLCVSGRCVNCLVAVDGVPNVRACTEPVREGITVTSQNAWPSVDNDALSVLDRFDWAMPVGFYYKAFHQPKYMWKVVQPIIRRVGGLGSLDISANPPTRFHHRNLHAEIAVVGGGPAGMMAAITAAESGERVVLLDDQTELGGHLRLDGSTHDLPGMSPSLTGIEIAERLRERIGEIPNIQVLSGASVFGSYPDNLLGVLTRDALMKLRARRLILATGSNEVPHVFENNDLPGVMLSTGTLRLLHLYG